jgi:hypothetical protein
MLAGCGGRSLPGMKAFSAILGSVLLALGFAACNSTSGPAVQQVLCALPAGTQVALAYPISGATGVAAATFSQVVVAALPALPSTWTVVLILPSGALITGTPVATIAANSVPTPFATPSFSSPTYQLSAIPVGSLPAASAITVAMSNQGGASCNGFPTLGTFSTQ